MLLFFQLSIKSSQSSADAAEQGDVVCQDILSHAVFDVVLVSLFLQLINFFSTCVSSVHILIDIKWNLYKEKFQSNSLLGS